MRVAFFADDGPHCETIDDQINNWLSENDVKVIDIKFSSTTAVVADSGSSAQYWHTSALVLYAEKPPIANYPQPGTSKGEGVGFLERCVGCDQPTTINSKAVCYDCKQRGWII